MNRILLQHGSEIRKFISFRQEDKDGSLYITFNRKGTTEKATYYYMKGPESVPENPEVVEGEVPKRFEVHYHTTGRINFTDMINPSIFGEPITAVTQNFWFASLIVPDFERLDRHPTPLRETDFVLPIEGICSERRQYDLCISPFGQPITSYGLVRGHFAYSEFYTLNVIESDRPIQSTESGVTEFTFVSPRTGLFDKQQISREAAHVKYQQMRIGHSGPIMYGPNGQNEYRVIFPGAATERPTVDAVFKGNDYMLEILYVSKSEVRFKVVDSSGAVVTTPVKFTRVKLGDCRLTLR